MMKGTRFIAQLARLAQLAVLLGVAACAATSTDSQISIQNAWARPVSGVAASSGSVTGTNQAGDMNGPVSAIYMTIENSGGAADRLMSINTPAARVAEVHETYQQDGGLMGMRPVMGGLVVPAKGSVDLKPGSYHVMLMGLAGDLKVGQTIRVSLTFQSGKHIDVDVPVKDQSQ